MPPVSTTASYKKKDTPGQLMLDFGAPSSSKEIPAASVVAVSREQSIKHEPHPSPPLPPLAEPPFSNLLPTLKRIGPETGESSVVPLPLESPAPSAGEEPVEATEWGSVAGAGPPNFSRVLNNIAPAGTNPLTGELPAELEQLAAGDEPRPEGTFITDVKVIELIELAAGEYRPGEVRSVRVRFFPFRSTLYSFKYKRSQVQVKFHLAFRRASDAVILQAARLMLCRSRVERQKIQRKEYDRFIRSIPHTDFKLPGARKSVRTSLSPDGVHRHLADSFQRVNEIYFKTQLKQPELCWSPVHARRILGSYQARNDRLIISRVFDSPKVPEFVLDFLMYHELLHKFLGIGERSDGKRCLHGHEFKVLERRFHRYGEAKAFLDKL
jgi:hypothetical protein